jgi:hypothetical protein
VPAISNGAGCLKTSAAISASSPDHWNAKWQVQPLPPLHAPVALLHGTPLQQSLFCVHDWP